MIRVFIIAQAIAVRVGLRSLLTDDQRLQVVGEASTPDDEENGANESDVVIWYPTSLAAQDTLQSEIMNIKIGETTGLLLIHDDPKVLEVLSKLQVRSWGMLSSEFSQAELIAAVAALHEGLDVIYPIWAQYLSPGQAVSRDEDIDRVESLTGREVEILQLLALGLTNKQIAVRLGISAHTVKFHVSAIFGKMRTTNRMETVKLGLKMGLIVL